MTAYTSSGIPFAVDESDDPGRPVDEGLVKPRIIVRAGGYRVEWPRGDQFWRPTLKAAVTQAVAWWTMPRFEGSEE